jgi:hypothetical protein
MAIHIDGAAWHVDLDAVRAIGTCYQRSHSLFSRLFEQLFPCFILAAIWLNDI